MKYRLLFLCTGNSCRSQMAEALTRSLWPNLFDVFFAGIESHGLNPHMVAVMAERGIDMAGHRSKTLADLPFREFDFVVTVCGHADKVCPIFPAKTQRIHHGFDDPPGLAATATTPEEALGHYRRVRDEIAEFIRALPEILAIKEPQP